MYFLSMKIMLFCMFGVVEEFDDVVWYGKFVFNCKRQFLIVGILFYLI